MELENTRLNYDDIAKVANDFIKSGELPTSIKIHQKLGRGSMSTINKHFKVWRVSDDAKSEDIKNLPAEITLPDDISELLTEMGKRVLKVSQEKHDQAINLAQMEKEDAIKKAEAEKEEYINYADVMQKQIEDEQELNVKNKETISNLQKEKNTLQSEVVTFQHDIKKLEKTLLEKKEQKEKLGSRLTEQQKLTSITETKLQTQLAENQKLQQELSTASNETLKINDVLTEERTKFFQLQSNYKVLQTENKNFSMQLSELKETTAKTIIDIKKANDQLVKSQEQTIKALQQQQDKVKTK